MFLSLEPTEPQQISSLNVRTDTEQIRNQPGRFPQPRENTCTCFHWFGICHLPGADCTIEGKDFAQDIDIET